MADPFSAPDPILPSVAAPSDEGADRLAGAWLAALPLVTVEGVVGTIAVLRAHLGVVRDALDSIDGAERR